MDTQPTAWIGIDPGKTGAIAFLRRNAAESRSIPYIGDEPDVVLIARWFREFSIGEHPVVALEFQQAMPGQGVVSMFTLGKGYGMLLATCGLSGIATHLPRPAQWKKDLGIPPKSDKDYSRQLAQRLFPDVDLHLKKDHGRAEALLLAYWCQKQEGRTRGD